MDVIRKGYADTAFGQIHFRRVEGDGTPVILLHRTPASSESFERMLRLLAGKRGAIALDTPGFGMSFRPNGFPTTVDYGRWLLAAIDALGIGQFHLCAHHTGTHFSVEMALQAPERVRSLLLSGVLYAEAEERAAIRTMIGDAPPIDEAGAYVSGTWSLLRSLYKAFHPAVVHAELLGALASPDGRNQAFGAILAQNFAAVLQKVTCPVAIAQAIDDPLASMLDRVRADHPNIPVTLLGAAETAAPELQSAQYAAALLRFIAANEPASAKGTSMTDRRFELVKTETGFDLAQTLVERPKPGPGEVLVKVHAVSLNRRDLMIRELSYPVGEANHFTPLSDAAGEIVAIGEGVTRYAVGDRVTSTFFQNWPAGRVTLPAIMSALGAGGRGVLADHVVLAETGVAHLPDGWSFEEGASISCAAVTAWSGFQAGGGIRPGDWALVIGTGGVAIFALQIAVAAGAKVIVLSSSDEKLERARTMGASATVNYKTYPEWEHKVRELTGGGVHHAIELGGAGTLAKSLASATIGGHIAMIGGLDGFGGEVSGVAMVISVLRVSAVTVGSYAEHVGVTNFMVDNKIRPVIDSVFGLDKIEDAYARANAGAFGKVVVRL